MTNKPMTNKPMTNNPANNNPTNNQESIDDDQLYLEIEQSMIAKMRAAGVYEEQIDDIHNLFCEESIHSPEDSVNGEKALEQDFYEQAIRLLTGKSSVG